MQVISTVFFLFQAKKAKTSAKDDDVPKPEQEDVDDEQVEEKPDVKPEKKTFPPRFTEKGLWRVHNAVYRVSFVS